MNQFFSIILGLFIFFIYLWIVRQREGFEPGKTPEDSLKALKSAADAKNGNLNLSVYKQNYQDMVSELDRYANLTMLEQLSNPTITSPAGANIINNFSKWFEFKKNLGEFKTILGNMS